MVSTRWTKRYFQQLNVEVTRNDAPCIIRISCSINMRHTDSAQERRLYYSPFHRISEYAVLNVCDWNANTEKNLKHFPVRPYIVVSSCFTNIPTLQTHSTQATGPHINDLLLINIIFRVLWQWCDGKALLLEAIKALFWWGSNWWSVFFSTHHSRGVLFSFAIYPLLATGNYTDKIQCGAWYIGQLQHVSAMYYLHFIRYIMYCYNRQCSE